jgi:hypothetical protein
LLALFAAQAPLRAYTIQYRDALRAFPAAVVNPTDNHFAFDFAGFAAAEHKAGSDVIGAVRRALRHWSSVSNVQFFETSSTAQAISPANAGDHLNLITVAADNAAAFHSEDNPGRTRVFSDTSGAITEADIALNPDVLFSSDGTVGTYDLESTFTHEGWPSAGARAFRDYRRDHAAATGDERVVGLPAFTQRSLSFDDVAGARALYGSRAGTGSLLGGWLPIHTAGNRSRCLALMCSPRKLQPAESLPAAYSCTQAIIELTACRQEAIA